MSRLKKYALLICITLVCNNSRAQWSDWVINYENGIPVSTTPEVFLDGRPMPFFTYYRFKSNSFVVKGRIIRKHSFLLKIRNPHEDPVEEIMWDKNSPLQFRDPRQNEDLYSLELEVLDDFGKNLPKTIVLALDTCGGYFSKDFLMDVAVDHLLHPANENEDTGYFFFYKNKVGQLCYSHVMCIVDNRVAEMLTRWDGLTRGIKKKGMPVPRFERKLKRKIK